MKRIFVVLACLFVLSGCGSHGYEGKYEGTVDLLFTKQTMIIEISDDFLSISKGKESERSEIEEAEVIEKNGTEYLLVTEEGGGETYFQIIDDDTLILDLDIVQVKLERI